MENNNKGQTIFLSVVGIATLLVAIIGATFAWFSATVTGNEDAKSVIVNTATLGITYTNGNELKLENAIPGAKDSETFTVANSTTEANGGVETSYTMKWVNVTNDFTNTNDLVYSLSGTSTGSGTTISATNVACPTGEAAITGTGTVAPEETHTYTLTVEYKETNVDQNSDQGKKFAGKIQVDAVQTSTAAGA